MARRADDLMSELRACYPRTSYYVLPRQGFVVRAPYWEVTRLAAGIAHLAHRIEALPAPDVRGPPGTIYVHKNRDGGTGWLTPEEIEQGVRAARERDRLAQNMMAAAMLQLPNVAPLQDIMRAAAGNLPQEKPQTPTVWERLGRDDFGE